jgi:hypothetical protein
MSMCLLSSTDDGNIVFLVFRIPGDGQSAETQ